MPPQRPLPKKNKIDDATRLKLIECIVSEGYTVAQAAKRYQFPYSTVRTIYNTFSDHGRTTLAPRGGNRHPLLQAHHVEWLTSEIDRRVDCTVSDLHRRLNEHFDLDPPVSKTCVQRAISENAGYTLKMIRVEPDRYNDEERIQARRRWAVEMHDRHQDLSDCIFLDESGFNLHIHRHFGRAHRGIRPNRVVPTQKGANMSLLVAVDKTGIVASEIKFGSYKSHSFTEFLQTRLFPALQGQEGRRLILDNARIHKTAQVQAAVDTSPHTLVFLPPYSPHLNAAEWAFSCVKTHVKKQDVQRDRFEQHVLNALALVSREKASGWIRDVNRNFLLSVQGEPLGQLYDNRQALVQLGLDPGGEQLEDPYREVDDEEEGVDEEEVDDARQAINDDQLEQDLHRLSQQIEEEWDEEMEEEMQQEMIRTPTPPPRQKQRSPTKTRRGTPYTPRR